MLEFNLRSKKLSFLLVYFLWGTIYLVLIYILNIFFLIMEVCLVTLVNFATLTLNLNNTITIKHS